MLCIPAQAWSEDGHRLIAVLAFRQFPKEQQQKLLRILKAHSRFEQDFRLPKKVKNADQWPIGHAGYWPDVARDQSEYNGPNWHYQLRSCLTLGNCKVPERSCDCPPDATRATKDLHIGQALNMRIAILQDKSNPDYHRALLGRASGSTLISHVMLVRCTSKASFPKAIAVGTRLRLRAYPETGICLRV